LVEYRNQWHPGYCSAFELGFREDKEYLTFDREYLLNSKPIQMDLLIIRKKSNIIIKNSIGKLFRKHNIIEFKSPNDSLNYDTYVKTVGYACLYKASEKNVGEIEMDDITLTFVRSTYPRKLMGQLIRDGFTVSNPYKGIYYIEREGCIPAQVVLAGKVGDKENVWLRSLSDDVGEDAAREMVSATQKLQNKGDKDNAEAVLQVSVKANIEIYDRIKEEKDMACEALRELFKPELEEATQKGRQEGIELGRTEGRELGLEQGGNQMIYSLVQDGIITAEVGANKLGISLRKLKANMVNTGFVYPGKK
jgi:hypothetical protein